MTGTNNNRSVSFFLLSRFQQNVLALTITITIAIMYNQKSEGVLESESHKVFWGLNIQCDETINTRRPDIVILNPKQGQNSGNNH